jgi:ribosomal protein S18 acetylase RimI-like enzyme
MPKKQAPTRSNSDSVRGATVFGLAEATAADADAIAAVRNATAQDLTARFGYGYWSSATTARGVLADMRQSVVYVLRQQNRVVATLRLSGKKPWAIDKKYFSACDRPLYLTSMAVAPALQGRGVGRRCVEAARRIAAAWPADGIRLDAYDAAAGAAGFYEKCGFRPVARVTYRRIPLVYFESIIKRPAAAEEDP